MVTRGQGGRSSLASLSAGESASVARPPPAGGSPCGEPACPPCPLRCCSCRVRRVLAVRGGNSDSTRWRARASDAALRSGGRSAGIHASRPQHRAAAARSGGSGTNRFLHQCSPRCCPPVSHGDQGAAGTKLRGVWGGRLRLLLCSGTVRAASFARRAGFARLSVSDSSPCVSSTAPSRRPPLAL